MKMFPYIFVVKEFLGIWRPIKWSFGWRKNMYSTYSSLIIVILCFFTLSQTLHLLQFIKDVNEVASTLFMLVMVSTVIYKAVNMLHRRRDIIRFIDILTTEPCRPNGPDEVNIQNEFDRQIKQYTLWYATMIQITVLSMFVGFFMNNVPNRTLPYKAWIPYDYSTRVGFWSAYLHQIFAQGITAALCGTYDTLFCGLMAQVCAQLKILQFRLQFMLQAIIDNTRNHEKCVNESVQDIENRVLERCIRHHHIIIDLAKSINEVFSAGIFTQCTASSFLVCTSIYVLLNMKAFSTEFMSMSTYSFSMLAQIFCYCWCGNEIIIESIDVRNAVYAMDWRKLNVRTQKNLLIVMSRTSEPIRFTSGSVIVLSLDTYKSLLKLSYSMYNLFQRVSKQ